jgi:hypothetical protein
MESRNIVLKTMMLPMNKKEELDNSLNNLALKINWDLTKPPGTGTSTLNTINGQSKLAIEDLSRILSQPEHNFIFELNHASQTENDFNFNPCFNCGIELLVHSRVSGKFSFQFETNLSG